MERFVNFLALLAFVAFSCSESNETRMQRFLIQGNEKIREQEYEQAEKFFLSALKLDSCFADALNNLGTVAQRRKDLNSAIRYYSTAIRCNEKFFLAYINRANAHFENSQFREAFTDAKNAEALQPDSLSTLEIQALAKWKMRSEKEAVSIFRKILSKNSNELNTLINLGTLYTYLKDTDSADYFLGRATSVSNKDPRIFNARAMLSVTAGDLPRSMQWIDQALAADPNDAYFLNNKGYILLLSGRDEEGVDFIDRSIASDPYNGWAYRNKGIYHFKQGNFSESLRLLKMAEKMDSAIEDLQLWLGKALLASGQDEEGCDYLREALRFRQLTDDQMPVKCN